jgi:hypothetical protein
MIPFTRDQFLEVFAVYNAAIWPAQAVAYLLGAVSVALLLREGRSADRLIAANLAAMWLWTGIAYHWLFFTTINGAAILFGTLFVIEGALLLRASLIGDRFRFGFASGPAAWTGIAFILYAAALYPVVGVAFGHAYPTRGARTKSAPGTLRSVILNRRQWGGLVSLSRPRRRTEIMMVGRFDTAGIRFRTPRCIWRQRLERCPTHPLM